MSIQDMLAELRRAQEELDILAGDMAKVMSQLEDATERAEYLRQEWEASRRREMSLREKFDLYVKSTIQREKEVEEWRREIGEQLYALKAATQPKTTPRDP